jgi:hypothetical protein
MGNDEVFVDERAPEKKANVPLYGNMTKKNANKNKRY